MRDLYKLALLVPSVIILAVFLLRMAPGDIDITAGDGIDVQHRGEDFTISITGTGPGLMTFRHGAETPVDASSVNIFEATGAAAGISIDLEDRIVSGTPTAQYEIGVDLARLEAELGDDTIDITVPDGPDPDDEPERAEDVHQVDVRVRLGMSAEITTPTQAGETTLTLSLDRPVPPGGADGQVLGLSSTTPDWIDPPTELPTGGSDGQVLTLDGTTPTWETPSLKSAEVQLSADDVAALDTTRIQLIPSPAQDSYILAHYMAIIKTGGPGASGLPSASTALAERTAWKNTQIHLSLAPSTGGLVVGNSGGPDCVYWRSLHEGLSPGWFNADDYQLAVNLISTTAGSDSGDCGRGGGAVRSIYTSSPLSIVGFASDDDNGTADTSDDRTAAQVWDANTANLSDLSIHIIVYYETITP